MDLVLASSSPFRRALLDKLQLDYITASPEIDETARPGESIEAMVCRLSRSKAQALSSQFPEALIIGSDQSAAIDGQRLEKPGNHETAVRQLQSVSGREVTFYTGLCLLNTVTGEDQVICDPFIVSFRHLSTSEIENYLQKEQPYNCAGSFKSEALGISLFESLKGSDPNSLIGLPLIELCRMLRENGMPVI